MSDNDGFSIYLKVKTIEDASALISAFRDLSRIQDELRMEDIQSIFGDRINYDFLNYLSGPKPENDEYRTLLKLSSNPEMAEYFSRTKSKREGKLWWFDSDNKGLVKQICPEYLYVRTHVKGKGEFDFGVEVVLEYSCPATDGFLKQAAISRALVKAGYWVEVSNSYVWDEYGKNFP